MEGSDASDSPTPVSSGRRDPGSGSFEEALGFFDRAAAADPAVANRCWAIRQPETGSGPRESRW